MLLRWALPIVLGFLTTFYEIGPGRSIHDNNVTAYFDLDIAFYGLGIPLIAFATLTLINRWLNQKEQIEKQARATEQKLASIMTASADAIISTNQIGKIESWNRGAELLFGYSASEFRGKPLSALMGGGEAAEVELRWLAANVQQAEYIRGHETTCRDTRGREIAVELTATRLTNEQGLFLGMSVILRDVTERKYRDAEIRHLNASLNQQVTERTRQLAEKVDQLAEANVELKKLDQTRAEFVSVVSHQIRAPLTNMRGAVERMQHDCSAINNTCARMFVIQEQQIGRLERLVKDVLNAARIEAGDLLLQAEPISLLPVVQQVVEQTRVRTANRLFRILAKPGLPLVFADRDRVAEVLVNLLDNADKYSPPDKEVIIDMHADQTEVTLSVQDFGRGLGGQEVSRVFDKFYRADNSDSQSAYGYGLGLYVCRQLVVAQGGRIWAENGLEGGAVFSFALPVAN